MPRDGTETRRALMDAAEAIVLDIGYSAASVDRIIARAGVTKGSFFHHFASKADLARALVDRYAELDLGLLESNMAKAERLSRDPKQQLLIFVGLFRESAAELTEPYPGCLFGAYCYEAGLFDEHTMEVIRETMRTWRERLGAKLREAEAHYPPRLAVDLDSLADMITVVLEGAFIVSKTLQDPRTVAQQIGHYRAYLDLLFDDGPAPRGGASGGG